MHRGSSVFDLPHLRHGLRTWGGVASCDARLVSMLYGGDGDISAHIDGLSVDSDSFDNLHIDDVGYLNA